MTQGSPDVALDYGADQRKPLARIFRPGVILALIILGALGLRFYSIGFYSFWLDEFLSVENSTGRGQLHVKLPSNTLLEPPPMLTDLRTGPGLWKIWSSLDTETHPPLYFMALNVWRHVFGEGDIAARALSVAGSLAAIVLLYFVMKLLHGTTPALWAAAVMAVAGPQIQYSQEARPYTLILALLLAATLALVRIEKLGPTVGRAAGLALAVLAMLLTQYLAFAPLVALGVYCLIRLRGRSLVYALAGFAVGGMLFAVTWGPRFLEQSRRFTHEHKWMLESEADGTLGRTLHRAATLPLRYFTEPRSEDYSIGYLGCVMFALPLLLLRQHRDLLLWCLLMFAPVLQVAASDLMRHAWALAVVRYTFLSTAAAYALVAAMLAHKSGWMRHVVPLTITAACLGAIQNAYQRWHGDWREPAKFVRQNAGPDDLLIFPRINKEDWGATAYYLHLSHYAKFTTPSVMLEIPPEGELLERMRKARKLWVLTHRHSAPIEQWFGSATLIRGFADPYIGMISQVKPGEPTTTRMTR